MNVIKFHPSTCDQPRFVETDVSIPAHDPHDLLVRVEAISINPVDTKVRAGHVPVPENVDVLGWDAAGTVVSGGTEARLFKPGDEVFYAGTFTRPGANAELHLVDERMVGLKPTSLSLHWEMVFTRPLFDTSDLIGQHHILSEIASLVDAGILRTTMTRCLSPFSSETLIEAHRLVEGGAAIGKVVMSRAASGCYSSPVG